MTKKERAKKERLLAERMELHRERSALRREASDIFDRHGILMKKLPEDVKKRLGEIRARSDELWLALLANDRELDKLTGFMEAVRKTVRAALGGLPKGREP